MPAKPKVVFTTQSETWTGVLNDIEALAAVARAARRRPLRRRGLRSRRRRAPPGRVGRRHRRLRLAEVPECAPRGSASRRSPRRRSTWPPTDPAAVTTSTGTRPRAASGSAPPDSPFTTAVTHSAGWTSPSSRFRRRSRQRLRAARDPRPGGAGRRGGSRAGALRPGRSRRERRHRGPAPEGIEGPIGTMRWKRQLAT